MCSAVVTPRSSQFPRNTVTTSTFSGTKSMLRNRRTRSTHMKYTVDMNTKTSGNSSLSKKPMRRQRLFLMLKRYHSLAREWSGRLWLTRSR